MNQVTHSHHILPKHAGGTDDPSNLVELSIQDHAEAHKWLFIEHGRWQDALAWLALSGQIGYDEATLFSSRGKRRPDLTLRNKISNPAKTPEARRKNSDWHKGKSNLGHRQSKEHTARSADARSLRWFIIDPQLNTYIIKNLQAFCREHDLNQGNLQHHRRHKQWRCVKYPVTTLDVLI